MVPEWILDPSRRRIFPCSGGWTESERNDNHREVIIIDRNRTQRPV